MKIKNLLLTCLLFLLPAGVCCAEWIDGEVEKIDPKTGIMVLSEVDPITNAEETDEIVIQPSTTFSGVKSLKELRAGDDVTVEAQYDEPTDSWRAISVEMAAAGD